MKPPPLLLLLLAVLGYPVIAFTAEIHDAAKADDVVRITAILATNKDLVALPGTDGLTPLHMAARDGKMKAVVVLLQHGADVNAADTHGCTPLHSAVYGKHVAVAEFLLNHKATVHAARKDGSMPLWYAVQNGDTNVVGLLLKHGARHGGPTEAEFPLLHAAAKQGHTAVVAMLVTAGVSVDVTDSEGRTALHVAAKAGDRVTAEWLLQHGANADAQDKVHFTPRDYVTGATNTALASLLEERMKSHGSHALPEKVGEAGDPDHLLFEGLQQFTPAQVRRGLVAKPSYMIASHPQANMGLFLDTLKAMLESGYQGSGFPDAKAEVRYDFDALQIRAKVSEGPSFSARKIRVIGTKLSSGKQLVRWFTTPATGPASVETVRTASVSKSSKNADGEETSFAASASVTARRRSELGTPGKAERPDEPLWESGKPADFSTAWATQAVAQVESCLAEQGFFFPRAKIELQRDPAAGAADLLITVLSEGPPGVIGNIQVAGAQRNTPADVLRFLDLRKGGKISASRLAAARKKLWDCGRFWNFSITPEFGNENEPAGRHVSLSVEVNEQEGVARLHEPLSPAQLALLRLCKWLEGFSERDEDILVRVTNLVNVPIAAELILSPKRGLLLNSADLDGRSPVAAGFMLTPESVQLCGWALGAKVAAPRTGCGDFFLHLLPLRDGESNRFNLLLGASYHTTTRPKPMMDFDVQLSPAAFLDLLNQEDASCRLDGRMLVISDGGVTLRADAATGRVLEVNPGTNLPAMEIRFDARVWAQASGDFAQRAAALTNLYVPDHGLSSLLGLVVTELARWQLTSKMNTDITAKQRARAVAALRKLVNPQYFYAADTFLGGADTNRFDIPMDETDRAIQQNSFAAFSGFLLEFSRQYFPKYSWPWTASRELVFKFMNLSRYTDLELQRLYSDEETGPIGCLVIASLFGEPGSPLSKAFAMEGLLRMGPRDFLRDCNLFLRGESGLARSFGQTVEALRNLPEDEVTALAAVLPEAEANLLRESATALRAAPEAAPASVLAPAIGKYWDESLRAKVRRALQKLTLPPESAGNARNGALPNRT